MSAVRVLMLLLVCAFTAAEDFITCEDVTGHVGDKFNLNCRVSDQSDTCDMKMYKFMNKDKDIEICREILTCKQLSFSCPYTANEVMTSTFKFFIQTTCGAKPADFTVNIAEAPKGQTADPEDSSQSAAFIAVIVPVIVCLIITGIVLKKKYNFTFNTCGFQRDYNKGLCDNKSECLDTQTV